MEIIVNKPTFCKSKPIQSSSLSDSEKIFYRAYAVIYCQEIKEGGHNHWAVRMLSSKGWWFFYKPHVEVDWGKLITYKHFCDCLPYARNTDLDLYFKPFNRTLNEFKINSLPRISAFIAQLAHESGSLRYKEELASGAAYEGRKDLGNIYRGDGRRYKGRGLIQLTGRHNYNWASKQLGVDLVNHPKLATNPELSCRIAGLYWQSRNLNKYADYHTERGFRIITRRINGGYNGWHDRLRHWKKAKKALAC